MEPFNLNKEREEGYFDEGGNFIEYVNEDDLKVKSSIISNHLNEEMSSLILELPFL